MSSRPPRRPPTWFVAAWFVAALLVGAWLLHLELGDSSSPPWPHRVRLMSSLALILSGLIGLTLVARGHHGRLVLIDLSDEDRREATTSLRFGKPSQDEAQRHNESELARNIVAGFPITASGLVLGLSGSLWMAFYPDEPAALRVLGTTGSLIFGLWLLGYIAARRSAGRYLRHLRRGD